MGSMTSIFLVNAPRRITTLRDSVTIGDMEAAALAAHSLKSSAGQIGAVGLQGLCADMERAAVDGELPAFQSMVTEAEQMLQRALIWVNAQTSRNGTR